VSPDHGLQFYLRDWSDVFEYLSLYGPHIALWVVLSAVTVYRREISCNRSYHEDDDEELEDYNNVTREGKAASSRITGDKAAVTFDNEEKELMTEELLEGAGLYWSGKPIFNFASMLWLGFGDSNDGDCDKEKPKLNDLSPEDLLDRAGNYASLEPIMTTIGLFTICKKTLWLKGLEPLCSPLSLSSSFDHRNHGCDPLGREVPPDVHVHIASFLHPRDVVTLSCVSKSYNSITHDPKNMTSAAIWKTLWDRDYSWIVFKWNIGKQALERSNCKQWEYSKDFYFLFGQSYLDYVLAGHNTLQSCLVGIHSNIYDITPFLLRHPGTPDTLMVHSGRDATCFFDDMGHSLGARRLAMSMCVVVNRSAQSGNEECGLFPTIHTKFQEENDGQQDEGSRRLPSRLENGEDNLVAMRRVRRAKTTRFSRIMANGGGTLHQMRTRFLEEREKVRSRNRRKYSNDSSILGHEVYTYFDPFTRRWRIWYTDTDLETIYLAAS